MTEAKPLTGRKVLAISVGAFAVIFGANMALVYSAVGTFPGLEVDNSYVASQTFDDRATAQRALHWTPHLRYENGVFQLKFVDAEGAAVQPKTLSVRIGRPTHARDDRMAELSYADGVFSYDADLDFGKWFAYVDAEAADGTAYSARMEFVVPK